MQYEETYNEILSIAKRLSRPRSFSGVLELLKIDNVSSKVFFETILANFDDLSSSFIIIRTRLISQLGVDLYYEREMVATILSMSPTPEIDVASTNKIFEQKGLKYRLPAVLDANQAQLIRSVVIANSCVEICRIGNMSERVYEIAFYSKYYLFLDAAVIAERHQEFSEVFKFTMDNILDMEVVKKRILDTLGKYGRLSGMLQDDSIDTMFHILDREIAAMEVVMKAKQSNQKVDPSNASEFVTLWLLTQDFKQRANAISDRLQREAEEKSPGKPPVQPKPTGQLPPKTDMV